MSPVTSLHTNESEREGEHRGERAINEQLLDMRRAQTILETGRGQATFSIILHYCRKLCKLEVRNSRYKCNWKCSSS